MHINHNYNILLSRMPNTERKLISYFIWMCNQGQGTRKQNTYFAIVAKKILLRMKENGLCYFVETLDKNKTKVMKRVWKSK